MPERLETPLADGRRAVVVVTDVATGDFSTERPDRELHAARRAVADLPWTWLHQVHGADVVVVERPGEHAGSAADAAVTAVSGAVLSVKAADCAPVALVDGAGAVGVAHAGWRGLLDGVLEAAVGAMRRRPGSGRIRAVLGPCIHPECYEFSPADLDPLVARFGDEVRATTTAGAPALDLPAAVRRAFAALDVPLDSHLAACTACGAGTWYSHRARGETGRHVVAAWIEP